MKVPISNFKPKTKRLKCDVCRRKLKAYEGKLCSCDKHVCLKHRYKVEHSCQEGLVRKMMPAVVPKKLDEI